MRIMTTYKYQNAANYLIYELCHNNKKVPFGCSPLCFSVAISSDFALSFIIKSTGDGGGVFENFADKSKIIRFIYV